jgi:Fe-S oxidoreductase
MRTYLILKPILVALGIIAGFGYFFVRSRRLVHLMCRAPGPKNIPCDRLFERFKVFFTEILLQTRVREKFLPGLAHTMIFFGFIIVLPHTIELMVAGIFPGFGFVNIVPGIYGPYAVIADIIAFLTLVGLAYGLFRRTIIRPAYLTDGPDSRLILLFTAVIILSFFSYNAFRVALHQALLQGFKGYYVLSYPLSQLLRLESLGRGNLILGLEISFWIHISAILFFLVYIPGSKHLHILAAIPNIILGPLEIPKPMVKSDLEDEEIESFGLGKVNELTWQNILNLYACTECGRCEEKCPADLTGKPLSPKRIIMDLKADLLCQSAEKPDAIEPIVRNGAPITEDVIWSCTTCRACESICPIHIQHLDVILEMRKNLVLMESRFPRELQETFANLEHQFNPWGFSAETRADWCDGLEVPLMTDHPEADILYFVGCAGAFDERGKKVSRATVNLLRKAGIDFAILGPEERCTGDSARRAGNEYIAQMLIESNVATFNRYKPAKILTGCPHCYNIIKNEYPQFGAAFEVVHHAEFFSELISAGRLKIDAAMEKIVTLHDSCYLGRWNGLYNAPRSILDAIAGVQHNEMERIGGNGLCCGAGGSRMFMEEKIGKRINIERIEEALATGAQIVAAVCPFCNAMLSDGVVECGSSVAVMDIAEILDAVT